MKRLSILVLALALALSLFGCGGEKVILVTDRYGTAYTIDREQQTISDETHTYAYHYEGDSEVFTITITYPNGGTYSYRHSDGIITGSGTANYNYGGNGYADGDHLAELLKDNLPKRGSARNILAALVLAAGGIFMIACPETIWFLESGWRYKDAEPSDLGLAMPRICGVIALIIAVILLLC